MSPAYRKPHIVLLGGANRVGSVTERAVRHIARQLQTLGASTEVFAGPELDLPMYAPENPHRVPTAVRLIEALRNCDGIIIGGSGYHGALSGMLKNALDYTEDMAKDEQPYFHGRVVGVIGTATSWQAVGTVLISLRSVVHALRGWPTPLGVAINTSTQPFADDGSCVAPEVDQQLMLLAKQVVEFAVRRRQGSDNQPPLYSRPGYVG
jgi:FMN reductase